MSLLLLFHPRVLPDTFKFILNGTGIRAPYEINEQRASVVSMQRTMAGTYTRDYFSGDKRIWTLRYEMVKSVDFSLIRNQYEQYMADEQPISWRIIQDNYPVATTFVHVGLNQRGFSIKGDDYLCSFDLVLVEA